MLVITENLLQQGIFQPQRAILRVICIQGWILQLRWAQQVLDCLLLWSNRVIDTFADWLQKLVILPNLAWVRLWPALWFGEGECVCVGWLLCHLLPWILYESDAVIPARHNCCHHHWWWWVEIKVSLGSWVEHTITILSASDIGNTRKRSFGMVCLKNCDILHEVTITSVSLPLIYFAVCKMHLS